VDARSTKVSLSVRSARPATATVELDAGLQGDLVIHALRPKRRRAKTITGTSIRADAEGVRIAIEVPDDQPAGDYLAPIVDARTNLPCGRLVVRLG
jgi:hypothetical protein